jgi:hypothetical protein
MPNNRLMDKENVVYIHNGVHSSTKNHNIISHSGKWMELEIIMLSEISQIQKTSQKDMFPLLHGI